MEVNLADPVELQAFATAGNAPIKKRAEFKIPRSVIRQDEKQQGNKQGKWQCFVPIRIHNWEFLLGKVVFLSLRTCRSNAESNNWESNLVMLFACACAHADPMLKVTIGN